MLAATTAPTSDLRRDGQNIWLKIDHENANGFDLRLGVLSQPDRDDNDQNSQQDMRQKGVHEVVRTHVIVPVSLAKQSRQDIGLGGRPWEVRLQGWTCHREFLV